MPRRVTKSEYVEELERLSQVFSLVFSGEAGDEAKKHLAKFCHAYTTCFHADPRIHAVYEGRREVWLEIQDLSTLTTDELLAKRILKEETNG